MKIEWDLAWGSHLPPLMKIMGMTSGSVLELGSGLYSSPYLYWICKNQNRELLSYENHYDWWKMVWGIKGDNKEFVDGRITAKYIEDWDKAEIEKYWDVVLVDHSPSKRRIEDIRKLANFANYILIHDTQRSFKFCDYSQIWPLFRYRYDFNKFIPWTSIVSNFQSLDNFGS